MKKAISNIAWLEQEDEGIYGLMREYGFEGLEIAPSRVWYEPHKVKEEAIIKFREEIINRGFSIIGMQALLFGKPELRIFDNEVDRYKTLQYLKEFIRLGAQLKNEDPVVLVFGSPQNRVVGNLSKAKATEIAVDFFYDLGSYAYQNGVIFAIEPNPKEYCTDFINSTEEALELVKIVNNKGFRLHIDTGTILINNEEYETIFQESMEYISHIHISEPYLEMLSKNSIKTHKDISKILNSCNYNNWISIEMKSRKNESNIKNVKNALNYVTDLYGF